MKVQFTLRAIAREQNPGVVHKAIFAMFAIQIKAKCEDRLESRREIISANQSKANELNEHNVDSRLVNCTARTKKLKIKKSWTKIERSKIGSKGDESLYKESQRFQASSLGWLIAQMRNRSSGWKRERFLIYEFLQQKWSRWKMKFSREMETKFTVF